MINKFAIGCGGLIVLFIVVIFILGLVAAGGYNGLVRQKTNVDTKWAQVQTDYQRRMDLIPNLVETVAGAANFEKSTLVEITAARASVGQVKIDQSKAPADAEQLAKFEQAQGQLGNALSRLLVVSERYPDLKANSNFRDLQAQLEGTENRISVARRDFNDAVGSYNQAIKTFPTVLYSGLLGFKERPYFASTAGAEAPPKVQFNFGNTNAAPARP